MIINDRIFSGRPERNAPLLMPNDDHVLVTAIVSTYNSADTIEGCIEDLHRQTVADRMEIIVIDSASLQNEGDIVRRLQKRFDNVRYVRTPERETVYTAWNRGVRLAHGRYLTNANTDDRRSPETIEKLIEALERSPESILAYGDIKVVDVCGFSYDESKPGEVLNYPAYQRGDLLKSCYPGPMPVWRKSLHHEFGLFNGSFVSAGDRELWTRVSRKYDMIHVDMVSGDFYRNLDGISYSNRRNGIVKKESDRIKSWYGKAFEKEWEEYQYVEIIMEDNFPQVIEKIDSLRLSGGAFKLKVILRSCTLTEWAALVEYKLKGIIYELIENEKFRLKFINSAIEIV